MVFRIYVHIKNGKVKKVEISDGTMTIRLDTKFVVFRNGRPIAIYNPISSLTLPLHPDYTVFINK